MQFILELGLERYIWASPWSQWTPSLSLHAVADCRPLCTACRLPG